MLPKIERSDDSGDAFAVILNMAEETLKVFADWVKSNRFTVAKLLWDNLYGQNL
jgi:hypothetical protein